MRKFILIALSFFLLACSTLSINQINTQPTPITPTPNETLIVQFVNATVLAVHNLPISLSQTPTPKNGCVALPCPTCAAVEVNSPNLPAPSTVSVPKPNENAKVILTSTKIPIPTHTAIPPKLYRAQSNSPVYLPNFAHQDLACKWMGVAGQVFDRSGNPAKNIVVVANGKLNGKNLNAVGLTGSSNLYGPGGYEIVLGNSSLTAIGTLTLTVYGLNGVALSDPVPFNTIGNCQKNLILINFIPVR